MFRSVPINRDVQGVQFRDSGEVAFLEDEAVSFSLVLRAVKRRLPPEVCANEKKTLIKVLLNAINRKSVEQGVQSRICRCRQLRRGEATPRARVGAVDQHFGLQVG